uniref:CDPK n=1 Tax=Arundo donax TaxID=35708 RepID=A0A0A9CV70_ARUDO
MASLHHPDDRPDKLCSRTLGVVALSDDAVEELAAGAELHDEVHEESVLIRAADADDVGVLGEVMHDLDLAPHVLVVLAAQQLALGDGLARVLGAVGLVHALVRGAELSLAQLLPDAVVVAHVRRLVRQHRRRPPGRPRRHRRRQPRVRIGAARLLPARALRVRLHCLRRRWSLPGSRTARGVPCPAWKIRSEARILTDDRSRMETFSNSGNDSWVLFQGNLHGLDRTTPKIGSWRGGLSPLGILGGMVDELGTTKEP